MKFVIAICVLASFCAVAKSEDEYCHSAVTSACATQTLAGNSICNARYGGIDHVENELQAYTNSQLKKSYEYLLLASYFNSYQKNRPGFQKMYQGLSDRSFDDAIDLMKQITRRGGIVDFNTVHESPATVSSRKVQLEVDELDSLAIALDNEKLLAKGAMHVHGIASHTSNGQRDPELSQYLEEKFLEPQAKTVRQLSGYANDLAKLMKHPDPSLSIYMFDEYLQKAN